MHQTIKPSADILTRAPTILVFDSGLGGLTVHREIVRLRPDARFVYCADDAAFPYGRLSEDHLISRVLAVMERLIATHQPDCVVIACNTASTLVMPHLRQRFALPFVGTVPAIKPACEQSASRLVSVLATPGTVARDYTRSLIAEFGLGCTVTLVGSVHLASLAEAVMRGEPADEPAIAAEIAPCFVVEGDRRTDTVVLACTHYPLLVETFRRVAPFAVTWIDPAPAIARRVVQLLGPARPAAKAAPAVALLTDGAARGALAAVFSGFGIGETLIDPLPLH
ncbi:glutamate racemase [Phreatobacter stygius]|uniref:Glutamate racemase n=1 Tax=Phreatobacter stygius TaxID=1940610 RepID=A0A4D7BGU9_9HYPH|nr:glutamate racemase [Phreatobacter stygius]QCI68968.1 glutamate racemase [Phreatobacter stygius]